VVILPSHYSAYSIIHQESIDIDGSLAPFARPQMMHALVVAAVEENTIAIRGIIKLSKQPRSLFEIFSEY